MKKRKIIVSIAFLISMLVLTGCTNIDNYLDEQMKKQSGIENEDTYKRYAEGNYEIDQEGYAIPQEEQAVAMEHDPERACITFSKNVYINTEWYKDSGFQQRLDKVKDKDKDFCSLKQGEKLYVMTELKHNRPSSTYDILEFRLSEKDENGDYYVLKSFVPSLDGYVLTVTDDYLGKELSIEPIGAFANKKISFYAEYQGNDDKTHELPGEWYVDEKTVVGNTVEISPIVSYTVSFKYDPSEYYFDSSEPTSFYVDEEKGLVTFERKNSMDEVSDCSVKLLQYIKLGIPSKHDRHVSVKDSDGIETIVKAGEKFEIGKLKYSDSITLETGNEWPEVVECRDVLLQNPDSTNKENHYEYDLIVAPKEVAFILNPSEFHYDHGSISFICHGKEITSETPLKENQKIKCVVKTVEDGYYFPEGTKYITVSKDAGKTREELMDLRFEKKKQITINLAQPECGGLIHYYIDGEIVQPDKNNDYNIENNTSIVMNFEPWEGWVSKYKNGLEYSVTQDPGQTVVINGENVAKCAFTESEEHKPNLIAIISKSVGENMMFDFEADGLAEDGKDISYQGEWYRSDYKPLKSDQKIGTKDGITISLRNSAIQKGTAVKIFVEMVGEDRSGIKPVEIKRKFSRLVDNIVDLQDPIKIYEDYERGTSAVWYKTIKITLSKVDSDIFEDPVPSKNSFINVKDCNGKNLKPGVPVEIYSNVTVSIIPNKGYYVDGKGTKDDSYQKEMRYDKYKKDIQKIIDEHPIKKYIEIELNSSDSNGTCSYQLNGNAVIGKIIAKPGDKLSLDYKICRDGFVIDGATGIFGTPLWINEKEKTESLVVTDSLDGKTLGPDSFGVRVRKE